MKILKHDPDLSEPETYSKGRMSDGRRTALAKCGNGHISSLSGHDIDADGTVSPSLVCPHDGCDWHENVKLEGWEHAG